MVDDSFIGEVDRSLREQKFVRVFLPLLVGAGLLVLAIVWAWNAWRESDLENLQRDTEAYYEDSLALENLSWVDLWEEPESFKNEEEKEQALKLVSDTKESYKVALSSLQSMSRKSPSGYVRFLSTLSLMAHFASRSDLDDVKKYGNFFIDDDSNNEALRNFTSLYLARYMISLGEAKQAIDVLRTLGLKSPILMVPSKELEAFALLSLGEDKQAKEVFNAILSMPNVPDSTLERAEIYAYNIP